MPFNVSVCQQYTVTDSWWHFCEPKTNSDVVLDVFATAHGCSPWSRWSTRLQLIWFCQMIASHQCFWRSNSAWCVVTRGRPVCKAVGIMLDRETKHILMKKPGTGIFGVVVQEQLWRHQQQRPAFASSSSYFLIVSCESSHFNKFQS